MIYDNSFLSFLLFVAEVEGIATKLKHLQKMVQASPCSTSALPAQYKCVRPKPTSSQPPQPDDKFGSYLNLYLF
jgi:predicted secreted protein